MYARTRYVSDRQHNSDRVLHDQRETWSLVEETFLKLLTGLFLLGGGSLQVSAFSVAGKSCCLSCQA